MTDTTPDVVRLQVEMTEVKSDIHELKDDVKALLALANQSKGGYKTVMLIAGISGTVGAIAAKVVPFLAFAPK